MSGGDLPGGWAWASVGDVSERVVVGFVGPSTQHYESGGVPFLMGKNVRPDGLKLDDLERISLAFHQREKKSQLKPNDVVVVRIGRSGTAAVVPPTLGEANCGGLVVIKSPSAVLPQFLAHYLNSPEGQRASAAEARGMTRQTLNTRSVEAARLPVPPLNEQRRILAKLERLLSHIRRAKEDLDAVPTLLEKLRQSVLAAAFRGDLTRDWREKNANIEPATKLLGRILAERRGRWEQVELQRMQLRGKVPKDENWRQRYDAPPTAKPDLHRELPPTWCWASASETCWVITNGDTPPKAEMSESEGDIPYIKISNLTRHGALDFSEGKRTFISVGTHARLARSKIQPGDVLMNIVGPPLGKVAVVPETYPEWNTNQAVVVLRVAPGLEKELLAFALLSDSVTASLTAGAKATVGQVNISLSACRLLPLPLPPEEEQRELVRRLRTAWAAIDAIAKAVQDFQSRMESLESSILAKAFRGELVPQDPADESASVLLDRIRAERERPEQYSLGLRSKLRRAGKVA